MTQVCQGKNPKSLFEKITKGKGAMGMDRMPAYQVQDSEFKVQCCKKNSGSILMSSTPSLLHRNQAKVFYDPDP
jgi:hypothetical protein